MRESLERARSGLGASTSEGTGAPRAQLSGALSRALLYANRVRAAGAEGAAGGEARVEARDGLAHTRLLCLLGTPDVAAQHVGVMKAIFAAKRFGAIVDACMLGHVGSSYLQQAAHLTGGSYLKPAHPRALAATLLEGFGSGPQIREVVAGHVPGAEEGGGAGQAVDLRASCFCHKDRISTGWVCSVCLSVFCERVPRCRTCNTKFDDARRDAKRKAEGGGDGAAGKKPAAGVGAGAGGQPVVDLT